jgi:hypothetical protein
VDPEKVIILTPLTFASGHLLGDNKYQKRFVEHPAARHAVYSTSAVSCT